MKQTNEKTNRFPVLRERLNILLGDMSTTDFAKKVGLTRQTMGFYLNGDRIPDSLTLAQICKSCNVSADWLLGFSSDPDPKPCATSELGFSYEAIQELRNFETDQKLAFERLLSTRYFGRLCEELSVYLNIPKADKIECLPGEDILFTKFDASKQEGDIEQEIYKIHPELLGRISVVFGINHAARIREDVVRTFDMMISILEHRDRYNIAEESE